MDHLQEIYLFKVVIFHSYVSVYQRVSGWFILLQPKLVGLREKIKMGLLYINVCICLFNPKLQLTPKLTESERLGLT